MRARRYVITGRRRVELEEFEFDPAAVPAGALAVEGECTAVSPGTETAVYTGADPGVDGGWCKYPWPAGYSGVGRVLAVGEGVTRFKTDERVVGFLRHASHCIVKADFPVATALEGLPAEQAAYVRLAGIAWTPLQHLRNEPAGQLGATAGVWGLGMIGNLTAQLLKVAGYRVTGIDPVGQRRELARRCGIDAVGPEELPRGETGFDVTVDTTGYPPATAAAAMATRVGGQLCLMTHWRQPGDAGGRLGVEVVNAIFQRALNVHGCQEWESSRAAGGDWLDLHREKYARLQRMMLDGQLSIDPLISHRIRPEQLPQAYEGLTENRAEWWGVVIDWTP